MQKKIIVTGANGFTGKYLMQELATHGFSVVGTWHKQSPEFKIKYNWQQTDLMEYESCEQLIYKINPDAVIHLAAQNSVPKAIENPKDTIYTNVLGTANLLEAIRKSNKNIRFILSSSAAVYYSNKVERAISEDMSVLPCNMYSLTKYIQEQLAERYRTDYNMNIICTRPFNYSGYLQEESCFIPNLCRQMSLIASGKQEARLNIGNLHISRDFLDVRDVVKAYRFLLENDVPNGIYNISSGKATKLQDIVNYLCNKLKIKVELYTDQSLIRKNDIRYICGDAAKIKAATKWTVNYTIFDTVDWIYESMWRKYK